MRMIAREGLPYTNGKGLGFPVCHPSERLTERILEKLGARSHELVSVEDGVHTSKVRSSNGVILIKHLP